MRHVDKLAVATMMKTQGQQTIPAIDRYSVYRDPSVQQFTDDVQKIWDVSVVIADQGMKSCPAVFVC